MRSTGTIGRRLSLIVGGTALLLVAVLGFSLVGRYNGWVTADENIDGAWAQVENQLQRRADLTPDLVEAVKGYATQETEIFENVAEARARLAGAATPAEAMSANAGLSSALGRLLAIAESYPDLDADQDFAQRRDSLEGTENHIAVERRRYNESVKTFNASIERFPNNMLATFFGFSSRESFEADEDSRQPIKIGF